MDKVWRIGLTGGIGSGKSTAAKVLAQLGAAVIDADAWARSVTAPGGSAIGPLRAAFGEAVLDAHGGLDRQRMRELAFSDPQVKTQLEAIVHPLVKQAIDQQAQSALAAGARVLVIDCSNETQIARVQARNGWPREHILAVIQAQATREQRQAAADWLILNDGLGLDAFEAEVAQLAQQWGLPAPALDK